MYTLITHTNIIEITEPSFYNLHTYLLFSIPTFPIPYDRCMYICMYTHMYLYVHSSTHMLSQIYAHCISHTTIVWYMKSRNRKKFMSGLVYVYYK